jgi:hypothetical protein
MNQFVNRNEYPSMLPALSINGLHGIALYEDVPKMPTKKRGESHGTKKIYKTMSTGSKIVFKSKNIKSWP